MTIDCSHRLRIAVVEDEKRVAARLLRLLRQILTQEPELLRHVETLDNALALMREMPLDLVFLDLNLYGEDGFRLLNQAAAESFHTIVVSAYQERAVEAFEHGVLDFIAKPYSKERLEKALRRAGDPTARRTPETRVLAVRKVGQVELVPVQEILFLRGAGDYVEITTRGGATHLHHKTLDRLVQLLPPRFLRVHRSFILDTEQMERLVTNPGGRYEAHLSDGFVVPISRTYIQTLKSHLEID